jgi:hypothetical protein
MQTVNLDEYAVLRTVINDIILLIIIIWMISLGSVGFGGYLVENRGTAGKPGS